ncbi:MAG: SDR family oxidoreductase [Methylococcales bacterium]|nr:SDR family oxidoreductase [Methylococcales bacterium]
MAKILIVGCGSLGNQLAGQLMASGHQVTGLKRNPPASAPFNYVKADIAIAAELDGLDCDFEVVYFIVSPDGRGNAHSYQAVYGDGLGHLLDKFAMSGKQPYWIFVSSTSVYGQSQGEWVDENSLAEPTNANSQLIRLAEQKLLAASPSSTIVRFSGIYGPGRDYLLRMAKSCPAIQQTPPYYTNRIHQEDCVGVLAYLLECRLAGRAMHPYYVASDDEPATMWEVMNWLAGQLHCPAPTAKPWDADATLNKRCSNQALKALGYQFRYPSYQDGYRELIISP